MITNIFLDLLVTLGCTIILGLICIVLAFTWWVVKFIAYTAKEAWKECSVAKTVPNDMSDVTLTVKNINEKKPSTNE